MPDVIVVAGLYSIITRGHSSLLTICCLKVRCALLFNYYFLRSKNLEIIYFLEVEKL